MVKMSMLSIVFGLVACVALSDQLVVAGSTRQGAFQGFESGKFEFGDARGGSSRVGASQVTKLVLDQPAPVSYLRKGARQEETGELQGFEKGAFTFAKAGQTVTIPMAGVKLIVRRVEAAGGSSPDSYPVPVVNTSGLTREALTPQQQAGLSRFSQAKAAFDAFVVKSTALMEEMDRSRDARRQALLTQLRERKLAEQPLRSELIAAYKALTELFPVNGGL
jgi:hypothetical protein